MKGKRMAVKHLQALRMPLPKPDPGALPPEQRESAARQPFVMAGILDGRLKVVLKTASGAELQHEVAFSNKCLA